MLRKRGHTCRKCERPKSLLPILQSQALYFGAKRFRTDYRVLRR